jgi:hypothetical protein
MRQISRAVVLTLLAWPTAAPAARQYVGVPDVGWDAVSPYVNANVVAELYDDEFQVFVCQDHTDRTTVTPFDDVLSDFALVLVSQAMRDDRKVPEGIADVTEAFRRRVPTLTAEERASYKELFWQALSVAPDVLPRIRSLFESSRGKGVIRCWVCEHEPNFAPRAKRVHGHR